MTEETKEIITPEILAPEILVQAAEKEQVTPDTKAMLLKNYGPVQIEISNILEKTKLIINGEDPVQRKQARALRLQLREQRCLTENRRKELKAEVIRYGRAVDGLANVVKFLSEAEEERLEKIEKHEEIKEQAKKQRLYAERQDQLAALGAPASTLDLGALPAADWELILEGARLTKQRRDEAAAKAEAERVAKEKADLEERERLRKEAEELRKKEEDRKLRNATRLSLVKQINPNRDFSYIFLGDMAEEDFEDFKYQVAEEKKAHEKAAADKAAADKAAAEKAEADRKAAEEAKAKADADAKAEAEEARQRQAERMESVQNLDPKANVVGIDFAGMTPEHFSGFLEKARAHKVEREKLEAAQAKAKELEKQRKAAEAKTKAEAEAKAKAEAEAAKAPDKEKFQKYLNTIIKTPTPTYQSSEISDLSEGFYDNLVDLVRQHESKLRALAVRSA